MAKADLNPLSHINYSLSSPRQLKSPVRVYLTEFLRLCDPQDQNSRFDEALLKEIKVLLDRSIFEVVLREELSSNANILGGRFVLSIKSKDTDIELYKARYGVQGHSGKEVHQLVDPATTLRQISVRL